jgi:hypothetical protein
MRDVLLSLAELPGVSSVRKIGGDYELVFSDSSVRSPTTDELLPAVKSAKITAINTECRSRLIARYGEATEQVSRSLGIYGATEKTAMETGIAATIDASNVASNAVLAATTVAAVEAVTVTWPAI